MIIVTGGSGFIGSYLQAKLHKRGEEVIVVDWLEDQGKWHNLQHHAPSRIVNPDDIDELLKEKIDVKAIFHMGAISSTTASNGDLVWSTNVTLSQKLWHYCSEREIPFIYASSAATYGAASSPEEFSDDVETLDRLRPLNLYGWSKHTFDQWVLFQIKNKRKAPSQWAGLKFFNVYGPNEYHKGGMISVVKVKYDEVSKDLPVKLFKSDVAGIADGMQARDFIWVGDVVDIMLWIFDNKHVSGLFNCGTGVARTYLDLAYAVCDAVGKPRQIEFINMPKKLQGQYQSYTCANMKKIKDAGYKKGFTTLESGVSHYINNFLSKNFPYL